MSDQPKGMARAALEREQGKQAPALPTSAAVQVSIGTVPLQDGRVNLVDRRQRTCVGIAVNDRIAEQTRRFFQ